MIQSGQGIGGYSFAVLTLICGREESPRWSVQICELDYFSCLPEATVPSSSSWGQPQDQEKKVEEAFQELYGKTQACFEELFQESHVLIDVTTGEDYEAHRERFLEMELVNGFLLLSFIEEGQAAITYKGACTLEELRAIEERYREAVRKMVKGETQ